MDSAHEVNPVTSVERNAEEQSEVQLKRTPLPKVQLFVALLIQFAEPITGTVIYPFINQFVEETGITGGDERKTGYYAGFIESVFFMGEATSVLYWGRASDYLGRKPILLLGPLGLTLTTLFFGLSKTFWFLVVWRCLQGVFNGNIGVSKTVMAEITDSTNMADAYALIAVMWGVGATLGPTMGGLLANPADRWPTLFGNPFFRYYPYFLPCAVAAAIAFMSFLIAGVALRETLPSAIRRKQRKLGSQSDGSKQCLITNTDEPNYGSTNSNDLETNHEISSKPEDSQGPPSIREILNPKMTIAMTVYAFASFVDMCAQALQPLVYFTSPANGGLGFDPYTIGVIMGVWGLTNGIAQTLFAGPIIRRIGPKNTVIWSLVTYLLGFVTFPMLRYYAHSAGYADLMTWVVLIAQLVLAFGRYITYTAIQIIIIESAPGKSSLGTTNGLAQAVGSIMRAIAPSVASSLFSLSLEKQLMGGNMVFMVLILLNGFAIRLAANL